MIKVLVLMGGTSAEREISLRSGYSVAEALVKAGYMVETLDFNKDNISKIIDLAPDVVFIALHGENGEDGKVQGLLDILEIPYTSSGPAASAIGMNKILTKKILYLDNIPTADFYTVEQDAFHNNEKELISKLIKKLSFPMVIKAPNQGSSIGTYIVQDEVSLMEAINSAFAYDQEILAEKFIDGIEVTASILGNNTIKVLPLIEITSVNEFYDYESKYTEGMCEHIIPARINTQLTQNIQELSQRVYKLLGCKGFARVDFMIDKENQPYVLEINTVPGMTDMSLVPDAARAKGIPYVKLCDMIVKFALE